MKTLLSLITIVYIKKIVSLLMIILLLIILLFIILLLIISLLTILLLTTLLFLINKLTFYFQMILLTYAIPLMIAKIVDQLNVTVVLNLLMISSHHIIPAHVVVVMQKIV